jgi:RimJ/RimL family protein N-acetyltransferase
VTAELAQWETAVGAFLAADAVAHTLPLSIAAALRAGASFGDEPPWFAWVTDDGDVIGAAFRTPPHLVGVTDLPTPAAAALGVAIRDQDVPGVVAHPDVAAAIAAAMGRSHRIRMAELQYRLDELTPPRDVPGSARPVSEDDDDLVVEWIGDFEREAGVYVQGRDVRETVRRSRARGDVLWLWSVHDEPVAMAGHVAPVHGVPRVGPVYTPPEHRGRGYGAAVTAAVCAEAFASGAVACTLFADADNPTSNAVYARLGFYPMRQVVEAVFDGAAAG